MRSSKIRGEIVLQKFPRENGFRAENPEKKRLSPLKVVNRYGTQSKLYFRTSYLPSTRKSFSPVQKMTILKKVHALMH